MAAPYFLPVDDGHDVFSLLFMHSFDGALCSFVGEVLFVVVVVDKEGAACFDITAAIIFIISITTAAIATLATYKFNSNIARALEHTGTIAFWST